MELRSLHIFIQAAELGSFTRAAEKLGYSQPTVSFQIKQLEHELGVPLFDRIGHTVSLTDAGRDVLRYAQKICHLSREMAEGAGERSRISGVVRLGMADSLCTPLIERGFGEFRKEYPQTALQITTAGTGELFRLLDHNEVDLVCTLDSHIYDTNYIMVSEEKVGVHFVAPADSPLAGRGILDIRELLDQPFLLTEKGMSYRRLLDENLARNSLEIHPVMEIGSADLICRLVAAGQAVSFLPDYVTDEAVSMGRIARLEVEGFEIELWKQLIHRRDKWLSRPMEAVIAHLAGIALSGPDFPVATDGRS